MNTLREMEISNKIASLEVGDYAHFGETTVFRTDLSGFAVTDNGEEVDTRTAAEAARLVLENTGRYHKYSRAEVEKDPRLAKFVKRVFNSFPNGSSYYEYVLTAAAKREDAEMEIEVTKRGAGADFGAYFYNRDDLEYNLTIID